MAFPSRYFSQGGILHEAAKKALKEARAEKRMAKKEAKAAAKAAARKAAQATKTARKLAKKKKARAKAQWDWAVFILVTSAPSWKKMEKTARSITPKKLLSGANAAEWQRRCLCSLFLQVQYFFQDLPGRERRKGQLEQSFQRKTSGQVRSQTWAPQVIHG